MGQLWRLTRNAYARRVYDALKRVGVTATRMDEWVASLDAPVERGPPAGVAVERRPPETLDIAACPALDERRDDETVLAATETDGEGGGTVLGYLFVSPAPTIHVHPLESDLSFDGAYVRRVFVHPHARNRGVATALVARARTVAAEWGLETVHALVAVDNRPSQWVFEANRFERRRRYSYLRLFGYRRRDVTDLDGRPEG